MTSPGWLGLAIRWLAVGAWMGGIFYLSSQSEPGGVQASNITSSFGHLGVYSALAFLLCWTLMGVAGGRSPAAGWIAGSMAFAIAVLYGVGDEIHQAYVPDRVASEADLALDAIGALAGVLAALFVLRTQHKNAHR